MNQSRRLIKFLSNYEPPSDESTNAVQQQQQQSLANYTESDVYADFVRVYLPDDAPTVVYDEKSLVHSDARTTNRLDNLIPTTTTTTSNSVMSNDSSLCHFLVDVSLYDKLMTIYNENEQINLQEIKHRLHEKIRRSSGDKITLGVSSAAAVAAVAAVSTIEDLENDLKNGANNSNNEAKTKTEVINTQTGIKYVAPMRGGHVSQIGRAIAAATAASQSMQASSSKSQFISILIG